jgi:hypothetical protein
MLAEAVILGLAGAALAVVIASLTFDLLLRQVPPAAYGGAAVGIVGVGVAAARAQGVGDESPGRGLSGRVTGREAEGLAAHGIGLRRIVLPQAHATQFGPQKRVVRLDAQGTLERRRRLSVVTAVALAVRLSDERTGGGTEVELPRGCRRRVLGGRRRRWGPRH